MDEALDQIESLTERLNKFEVNFKKCSAANRTEGYLEGRLIGIKELWNKICETNLCILSLKNGTNKIVSYFEDDEFSILEEKYYLIVGQIKDQLNRLRSQQNVNPNSNQDGNPQTNGQPQNNQSKVKLPKISLPNFSGSYHTWMSFENRFSNLIHANACVENVENVEKLEYLKSCVTGEAERTIQRFQVTDQNYK